MRKDEQNNSNSQDDFDAIEIVDLDAVPREHDPLPPVHDRHGGNGDVVPQSEQPAPVRVSLRSRFTRRQRIAQVVASAAVVIVAFVLILNSIAPAHTLLGLLKGPTPTPSPGLTLNMDSFFLDASPPWGTLTLDGHALIFTTMTPVRLTPGRHVFVWQAQPFQPIRCTLSVPVSASDTCKHVPITLPTTGFAADAQEVTFYDNFTMLPPAQQTALSQAMQTTLDTMQSTAIVQPGEQFVHFVGNRTIDTATQPLRATLHFNLSLDEANLQSIICSNDFTGCSFLHNFQTQDVSQNCAYICTEPNRYNTIEIPNNWYTVVIAHAYWDYTTMNGQVVATNQPDSELDVNNSAHFVYLTILWSNSRWQVGINVEEVSSFTSFACLAASDEFYTLPQPSGLNSYGFTPSPAKVAATGCAMVVEATPANPSSSAPANAPQAICFYRFGLILAANPLAHHYWPTMPRASTYEQSLALQIAAHPSG